MTVAVAVAVGIVEAAVTVFLSKLTLTEAILVYWQVEQIRLSLAVSQVCAAFETGSVHFEHAFQWLSLSFNQLPVGAGS